VNIHTHQFVPLLEVGQAGHRQLKFPYRRLKLLWERDSCLKYILEFVVGIPPTAGYSCFVKDKPETVGIPPTAGYSCFVKDKPENVGIPPTAGYSCFAKDKPEIVGIPPTAGYSCFVENNPEAVGNRLMAG
jgi:hypothetical protein